jgi:hypothetical protein
LLSLERGAVSPVIVNRHNVTVVNEDCVPASRGGPANLLHNTVTGNRDREGTGNIDPVMKSPPPRNRVTPPPIRAVLVYTASPRPGVMKFH